MVRVGEKCKECKYYGNQTFSCDYMLIAKKRRTITDGKKIDPKYCDKFEKGKRFHDSVLWHNGGMYLG